MGSESSENTLLLGRYKLGRLLGRGAFAKVYFAQSVVDGSSVAIKVINKLKIKNTSMEPRIIREISAMHRLDHPNIIRIHEVMATKTKIYIVMEYAKGGELFSEIASQGQLPESLARQYFQQLVSALHFCHINGVTHRDIKPQNLLLDCEGNLKISDFGLSALTEQTKDGLLRTACGTPAYTAPEVIGEDSYEGTKSDAWSCGIILFVLLAGFTPFDDSNIVVMYCKIMRMEFEFPSWFSKSVRSVISRLLDPNPDTRMTIEELMEDAWFTTTFEKEIVESGLKSKMIPMTMNAFDIISMSSGMDLSAIFQGKRKQERRFTSTSSPREIVEKVQETGRKLGYNIETSQGEVIELGKGTSKLSIEVLEVVDSSLFLVKLKVLAGELGDDYWGDWKAGLEEIVSSWHRDVA